MPSKAIHQNHDISQASSADLRASLAALQRACIQARKTALQTDTEIVVMREGKIRRISAKAIRASEMEADRP